MVVSKRIEVFFISNLSGTGLRMPNHSMTERLDRQHFPFGFFHRLENRRFSVPVTNLLLALFLLFSVMGFYEPTTPAQISLAWLLAQKPFIVPIAGTRNIDHLNGNLGAVNVHLTPADLREIDSAVSKIKMHGGRMNEEQMKVVDQTG